MRFFFCIAHFVVVFFLFFFFLFFVDRLPLFLFVSFFLARSNRSTLRLCTPYR